MREYYTVGNLTVMGVTMENVHPDRELHKDCRQLFDLREKTTTVASKYSNISKKSC